MEGLARPGLRSLFVTGLPFRCCDLQAASTHGRFNHTTVHADPFNHSAYPGPDAIDQDRKVYLETNEGFHWADIAPDYHCKEV